ncbi:MAG: hypothetical protein WEC33_07350 [Dehalococcoidia bacterium]
MTRITKNHATDRRIHARADAAYQFAICLGLAAMAGFVGTAGALVAHTGI